MRRVRIEWEPLLAAIASGGVLRDGICLDASTGEMAYLASGEAPGPDHVPIRPMAHAEALELLRGFVSGVGDGAVRRELEDAIAAAPGGTGAFGRAMSVLARHPDVADAWRAHERRALVAHASALLRAAGVEPENDA